MIVQSILEAGFTFGIPWRCCCSRHATESSNFFYYFQNGYYYSKFKYMFTSIKFYSFKRKVSALFKSFYLIDSATTLSFNSTIILSGYELQLLPNCTLELNNSLYLELAKWLSNILSDDLLLDLILLEFTLCIERP